MELLFQDKTFIFDEPTTAKSIIEKINELLENNYYFSHLIVNDKEIYEEPEKYIHNHFQLIDKLVIVVKTVREFVNDLLLSGEDYIKRAKPEIKILSDEFYQSPSPESWDKFTQLLDGIQWMNHMVGTIDTVKRKPKNWINYLEIVNKLEEELVNLEEAIDANDSVLIADLIQYEILPFFESLEKEIQVTIDSEGYRHDLN